MRRIEQCVLVMALAASAMRAQLTAGNPAWKGLEVQFASRIEPEGTSLNASVTIGAGRVHHTIQDQAHRRFFGYDLTLEPAADGSSAELRIEPLHPTAADSRLTNEGWTLLALPQYPAIRNVKPGDTVAIDVLANAETGQKIVDYLTLRRHGEMDLGAAARDFALSDVEMTIDQPKVFVNGKLEATHATGISAAILWLAVEGRGRFILSLAPNENYGFKRNGMVSKNGMLWRDGGAEIRIESNSRIAPAAGAFNLYVLHQPDWRGGSNFGGADRAELAIVRNKTKK